MSTDTHPISPTSEQGRVAEALAHLLGAEILTLKFKTTATAAEAGAATGRAIKNSVDASLRRISEIEEASRRDSERQADAAADQEESVAAEVGEVHESGSAESEDLLHLGVQALQNIDRNVERVVAVLEYAPTITRETYRHVPRSVRPVRDGDGAVDFGHDSSPVVGDAGAHSVGDVEVTPAVLRAVAGFISDSGVVYDVVRILKHLAIDLEIERKAGAR